MTLAEIHAQIICNALQARAVEWHGRRVVFVDCQQLVQRVLDECGQMTARSAAPNAFDQDTRAAVRDIVQTTLFHRAEGEEGFVGNGSPDAAHGGGDGSPRQ